MVKSGLFGSDWESKDPTSRTIAYHNQGFESMQDAGVPLPEKKYMDGGGGGGGGK